MRPSSGVPPDSRRCIAKTSLCIKKPVMAPVKREERRRIPLTAFTLVTVPEDPMLSVYLRSREAIDISMEKRMSGAKLEARSSSCATSHSTEGVPQLHHVHDPSIDKDKLTGRLRVARMELELDKFMATLTAAESPDAVVETIASTKGLKSHDSRETGQGKNSSHASTFDYK
ncbi:uncharacterized protein PV07_07139 [Cladophialophora immunda]|uniref:Uncharacterized protein n=1 Tax=Cladophialophora immunda TaxID=569365 RepID=A0A0D2C8H5_9EURO|nr:uncharacterized protein PV07_07139 [Cladophialophora immunda]KIW27398.1 hypothetical protein PV07_07139 [Cladophialophora immunda]OQV05181.1 hypothetical protein CLAIMM_09961 [Cladophialophora immunda]